MTPGQEPTGGAPPARGIKALARKLWRGWASRSLAIGAVATVIDLSLGGTLLHLGASTRTAAMSGTLLGGTITFFANRYFAFKEQKPKLAAPALRFLVVTTLSTVIHGQLVVWLRDGWAIPYVPAKMAADLCVFTFAQLLLLRYVVFPPTSSRPSK